MTRFEKVGFHRGCSLAEMRALLPAIVDDANRHWHNVIIRPRAPGQFQIDDLDEAS